MCQIVALSNLNKTQAVALWVSGTISDDQEADSGLKAKNQSEAETQNEAENKSQKEDKDETEEKVEDSKEKKEEIRSDEKLNPEELNRLENEYDNDDEDIDFVS